MSQRVNWNACGSQSKQTCHYSSSHISQIPSPSTTFSQLLLPGTTQTLKCKVWGHTWPASRPSLSSNRASAMYTASTEYWTISKIRHKEKKTELKCLMAYLYTFTNSQQKRWQVTHPFCMLTILMHIDVNTHAWMMHIHMATQQSRWPEGATLGAGEGVAYCKTSSHSQCAQRGHSGQCCFKAISKAESFLVQPLNMKICWSTSSSLPSTTWYIYKSIYIYLYTF